MSVARFICERLELATGISASAHVDKRERVAVRCKVCGAVTICVGNVRREREDHGRFRRRTVWRFWQIQRRIQFDPIPHRNLYSPSEIVVGRWWRRRWRGIGTLRYNAGRNRDAERQSQEAQFHGAGFKRMRTAEARKLMVILENSRLIPVVPSIA